MPIEMFQVTGMTCDHCVAAVTEEVSAIPGVERVTIDLRPGAASDLTVTSGDAIAVSAIRSAVDEAGYELVE